MSHTYATLPVSAATYAEIREKLSAAGYDHAFHDDDGREVIDMSGIGLHAVNGGCVGAVHVFPNTWPGSKCGCGSQVVGGTIPQR